MKIPISWLEKYIKLEHSSEEFGNIMTNLDSMQDGPIQKINGQLVIDLEVRQNRPDLLSIIGIAREYAAFINKNINYPQQVESISVEWGNPEKNLRVEAKDIVKRFATVEIRGIKVKSSPKWLKESIESYGIPSVNNIVDITNYVMVEYGMPLHAFDKRKLKKDPNTPLLTLRRARRGETFETWQGTKFELTKKDLVVSDANRPVAMAGIIGGANSDIDNKTKNIILEAATYNQASIRRSSLRHNIRTEASLRHEKFLNPTLVETAIRRALYLIQDICRGEIVKIEDFYEHKVTEKTIDFNINEIIRLGGTQLEVSEVTLFLERLGFKTLEHKEAVGIDKNILLVRIPAWRTDVNTEEDLVEEVLRLWGYENIPYQKISSTPPDFSTPSSILLEEKIRDILVELGLDEHITNTLCQYNNDLNEPLTQIKLENSLNADMNALRNSMWMTLYPVLKNYHKAGKEKAKIFEVGKIYFQKKIGEYLEEKRIATLYSNHSYKKIKGDLLALLSKLGIKKDDLIYTEQEGKVACFIKKLHIATLKYDGFELFTENLTKIVNIDLIPHLNIQTSLTQRIEEEISLVMNRDQKLGDITKIIKKTSDSIVSVLYISEYTGNQIEKNKKSVTFLVTFEDANYKLTRSIIEKTKKTMIKSLRSKYKVELRK